MSSQNKIIVTNYNSEWILHFQALKKVLTQHLGPTFLSIKHVGSTSVPNLKAKPILDIDVIVADDDQKVNRVIQQLALLGYIHRGDLGITGREAFKRISENVPFTSPLQQCPKHNLYVCRKDCISLLNHLQFRDYLRTHPEAVAAYSVLKTELAAKYPYHIDAYIAGKTTFITTILAKTGLEMTDLQTIQAQNS